MGIFFADHKIAAIFKITEGLAKPIKASGMSSQNSQK